MKDCNGKEIKVGDIVVCDTRDILLDIRVGEEYEVLKICPRYETCWGEIVPEFYNVKRLSDGKEMHRRAWYFYKREDKND